MDGASDKMAEDDGGHAESGGGAIASTSGSGSEEGSGGGRDCSSGVGVPDLKTLSDREKEMGLLLEQVVEVGQGLASIKRGRMMTSPFLRFSAEAWKGKLQRAEEARDKLNWLVTKLRKFVSVEKQEEESVSPLGIFPEEVWERILPHVVDSKDIESVLRAYPWLEGRVMKNKYWWLIDQVIPHIFPWLGTNDVLTCRQVCRRWNYGVDNFLENQKREYDFGSPLTGQVWIPEGSRAYSDLGTRFEGAEGGLPFNLWEDMEHFTQAMANHPTGKNVFVGRSVTFEHSHGSFEGEAFWEDVLEFLIIFGDHVWFIELYDAEDEGFFREDFGQFCDFVLQLLSRLPNLKSFHMTALELEVSSFRFNGSRDKSMEILELSLQSFPQLPQLETICMPCSGCGQPNVPECLIKFLVMYSSTTIKRLRLCPCRCKWMVAGPEPDLLPNLTDFALLKCTARKIVPVILRSLGAPKLGSLEVELHRAEADLLAGKEIASWAKFFPGLHSLKLSAIEYDEDYYEVDIAEKYNLSEIYPEKLKMDNSKLSSSCLNSLSALIHSVPSLTSLVVETCPTGMEFDFLKCFPKLQYLKMYCSDILPRYFKWKVLCGTAIWEMLQKLKEISIYYHIRNQVGQLVPELFFRSREECEWLKRKMWDSIPEGLFDNPDSILVRLDRSLCCSSSKAPRDLLLTSGDYIVGCIQLEVYSQANTYRGEAKLSRLLSWIDALNFLREYGGHIKRLDFGNQLAGSLPEFYRLVFEVLTLLPNLTALEMRGFNGCGIHQPAAQEFKLLLSQPHVPKLDHLETLKIHGSGFGEALVPPGIVKFLVLSSSEILKKLEVHRCDWAKIKDFVDLPSLVELKMEGFTEKSQVNEAFQSFKAPNLFSLDFHLRKETDERVGGGAILSWLEHFSKLETCKLWISDQPSWWNRNVDEERKDRIRECPLSSHSIPSLKSFRLMGCPSREEMILEFLNCFPNLEDLQLGAKLCHPYFDEQNLGGPDIWERLPKLQNVSGFRLSERGGCYGRRKIYFQRTRAHHESCKGTEAKPGTTSNLNCSSSTISGHGRGRGGGDGEEESN